MTLDQEWGLTYNQYVLYLLEKYGGAKVNYYLYPNCRSKNPQISRTTEGLQCHHIDEYKYIHLSVREFAVNHWESQLADRLVYADLIEHLLLHIKITLEYCTEHNPDADPTTERANWGFESGCSYLIGTINTLFQYPPTINWQISMYEKIQNRYNDYIDILCRLKAFYGVPDEIIFTGNPNSNSLVVPTKIIADVNKALNSQSKWHFSY